MNPIYMETTRLLTQVAPLVLVDDTFALKGDTAINLLLRDLPRQLQKANARKFDEQADILPLLA